MWFPGLGFKLMTSVFSFNYKTRATAHLLVLLFPFTDNNLSLSEGTWFQHLPFAAKLISIEPNANNKFQ